MVADLVFYTNPKSRGRIALWMLEEVGAPYTTHILDYGTTMKGADYRAINPLGKVPAIRHGDTVVSECAAICAYLADAFPQAGLAPPQEARGAYYRWMFFAAGPLEAAVTNRALGVVVPEDKRGFVGYGDFDTLVDMLAGAVSGSGYIAGDRFSAADVYVGSQIIWGVQFNTMEKRPEFIDYVGRLTAREAYRRADDMDNALMARSA